MKFRERLKAFKKCPRCGNRCLANQEKCEECGLVFSKLKYASNAAAKKKLAHFDRDYVLFTSTLPADISRIKLILYALLFGWVGGHYYYVGKYIKGLFMSLGFVYLVVGTIFNDQIVQANATLFYLPIAIYAICWLVSVSFVLSKRFKVPLYFDETLLRAEKDAMRMEYDKLGKQMKDENAKLKKNKKNKSSKEPVKTEKSGEAEERMTADEADAKSKTNSKDAAEDEAKLGEVEAADVGGQRGEQSGKKDAARSVAKKKEKSAEQKTSIEGHHNKKRK